MSGKSRFAWRASNTAPATVHVTVSRSIPAANTLIQSTGMMASMPDSAMSHSTASTPAITSRSVGKNRSLRDRASAAPYPRLVTRPDDAEPDEQRRDTLRGRSG